MKERLFSTAELGRLLSVSEATVKRWADTQRIGCFRTPGGHRKFRICDISTFVEDTGYEVTGTLRSLLYDGKLDRACEEAVYHRDLEPLVERFRCRAVDGDVEGLDGLFSCLLTRGICLATILDEVVSPAFASIGEAWAAGELSTVEEHVATRATMQALDQIDETTTPRTENSRLALTACLEGERHDLGARAVALVLRSCGYRTIHIGGDTPVDELATYLDIHPATLLAISSKAPDGPEALDAPVRRLVRAAEKTDTWLIAGGAGFSLLPETTRRKLTILGSCRELVDEVNRWERSA